MHALAPTMPADLRALLEPLGMKAQGERPRTERVLERLLDLHRCVALGNVLDEPRRAEANEPQERLALEEAQLARLRLLESKLLTSLRDLRAQVDQRFENAFTSGRGVPDAPALHLLLTDRGALQVGPYAPRTQVVTAVTAQVTARYVSVVDGTLEMLLKELTWRHADVQQVLQQGNAEMLRLAALDRVLDGVFRGELELCRLQLKTNMGATLETQLLAALTALGADAGVDALRPWFGPRGCIGQFLRDARRVCHALLDLEWSALMGLMQSAAQPTAASQPPSSQPELEKAEP